MSEKELSKPIYIVSDGTGDTAARMAKAALLQFQVKKTKFKRYKNIRDLKILQDIVNDARNEEALIVFTVVTPELRVYLTRFIQENRGAVQAIDVLGPLLHGVGSFLGREPIFEAGLLHGVDEEYFHRMECVEFAISHDDGRNLDDLSRADLILIGISRTSKTPLSLYLAHQGWKVANLPMTLGLDLPKEVYKVSNRKVIGLSIQNEELMRIRKARLKSIGQTHGGDYASASRIEAEVMHARRIFEKNPGWRVFEVAGRAIEETASDLIQILEEQKES